MNKTTTVTAQTLRVMASVIWADDAFEMARRFGGTPSLTETAIFELLADALESAVEAEAEAAAAEPDDAFDGLEVAA